MPGRGRAGSLGLCDSDRSCLQTPRGAVHGARPHARNVRLPSSLVALSAVDDWRDATAHGASAATVRSVGWSDADLRRTARADPPADPERVVSY